MTPARVLLFASLLYLGPIIAGWAGMPVVGIFGFAGIFGVYIFAVKPEMARNPLTIGLTVAVQMILASMCFALGRFLGLALPDLSALPILVPFMISVIGAALGIGLSGAWRGGHQEMNAFLDDALTSIQSAVPLVQDLQQPAGPAQREQQIRDALDAAAGNLRQTDESRYAAVLKQQSDKIVLIVPTEIMTKWLLKQMDYGTHEFRLGLAVLCHDLYPKEYMPPDQVLYIAEDIVEIDDPTLWPHVEIFLKCYGALLSPKTRERVGTVRPG